jgi:hypothetical protein
MADHHFGQYGIVSGNLELPHTGAWTAEVFFSAASAPSKGSTADLQIGTINRKGTVVDIAADYLQVKARIVDGPERFLETLGWFDAPTEPHIVAFGMLAEASVGRGARFHDVRLWPDAPVPEHVERLGGLLSGAPGFSVCPTARVDLLDRASCEASCERWANYTGPGGRGEGFVYRPESGSTRPDGGRVQPAMKVRGARYLELLYGWGYLDKLDGLLRRSLAPKRAAALVGDALARRVLQTFFRRDARGHDRAVAAFLGVDGTYAESLDPAL